MKNKIEELLKESGIKYLKNDKFWYWKNFVDGEFVTIMIEKNSEDSFFGTFKCYANIWTGFRQYQFEFRTSSFSFESRLQSKELFSAWLNAMTREVIGRMRNEKDKEMRT